MSDRAALVLERVLQVMRPLARLLIRHGLGYPVFAAALKRVFLDAAQDELRSRQAKVTDSALTLLCGVHRRDVRTLLRAEAEAEAKLGPGRREPRSLASQVVARWLASPEGRAADGRPRALPRSGPGDSFDALVAALSSDVRPRAVLEELKRLGAARETDAGIELVAEGFAPREGFADMAALFADNLADHAAAAVRNLDGERNFLEQAIFVDEITASSARQLHRVAAAAWQRAIPEVLAEAQARFDADAAQASPAERTHRARFGVYFYAEAEDGTP